MQTLDDLVAPFGITVGEFVEQLQAELQSRERSDPRTVTTAEQTALQSIGVSEAEVAEPVEIDLVSIAATVLRNVGPMMSTAQMARELGRSESQIRGRFTRTWRCHTFVKSSRRFQKGSVRRYVAA